MDFKWVGWAGMMFVGLTIINSILGGAFVSTTDIGILNQVGLTQKVDIGFMTIPVPNMNFIQGLMNMLSWNYNFFGGMGQLIIFFLYAVTFMVAFMLFITVIGLGINAIRSR